MLLKELQKNKIVVLLLYNVYLSSGSMTCRKPTA